MALKKRNKSNLLTAKATRAPARGQSRPVLKKAETAVAAPYHHGDLHSALLAAAERVLERDGLQGLTLRAAAREAEVSHAAPSHHFGDLTGLLSELAAVGFRKFNDAISKARAADPLPQAAFDSTGEAYVRFALAHPGLFQLMFRGERLDMQRPALQEALTASFRNFAGAVGAMRHESVDATALSLPQAADMVRAWSMVHGFALLAQHGRLDPILGRLPPGTDVIALLRAVLVSKTPFPHV